MSFIFAVLHIFYVLDPLQLDLCACIFSIFLSVMILCQTSKSLSLSVAATAIFLLLENYHVQIPCATQQKLQAGYM